MDYYKTKKLIKVLSILDDIYNDENTPFDDPDVEVQAVIKKLEDELRKATLDS